MATAPRTILLCVSENAYEAAATWRWAATSLFEPGRDALTLLHVTTDPNPTFLAGAKEHQHPCAWAPAEVLTAWPAFQNKKSVTLAASLLVGVGETLADWLLRNPADITVCGSGGKGGLGRFFLGSVSSFLVEEGIGHVLVVRPKAQSLHLDLQLPPPFPGPADTFFAPRKLAVLMDPTATSSAAQVAWVANSLVRSNDSVFLVLAVEDTGAMVSPASDATSAVTLQAAIDTIAPKLAHGAPAPTAVLLPGRARDSLLDFVNQAPMDLVVVGRRSLERKLKRKGVGRVSRYVLQHADAAVLVLSEGLYSSP